MIFNVLVTISKLVAFRIFRFFAYIKEEILTVLGTSFSESTLAHLVFNESIRKKGMFQIGSWIGILSSPTLFQLITFQVEFRSYICKGVSMQMAYCISFARLINSTNHKNS